MSTKACSCFKHVQRLTQQVSVMRKEINNLRKHLDSAVRAHRKLLESLQSLLKEQKRKVPSPLTPGASGTDPGFSLERGRIITLPIGFISSCFSQKNGTPRQSGVCGSSRACLTIQSSVFNNPSHALAGLQQFSHIWLIFLFHKNGHMTYKAKVKPPRLDGQKVGVYSSRTPHRPNAIGLSLAKLESITGDTVHLSGLDLIDGTPVLDIKPYIPEYDCPLSPMFLTLHSQHRHHPDPHSDSQQHTDSQQHPDPQQHPDSHMDPHPDPQQHTDSQQHPDPQQHPGSHMDPHPDPQQHTDSQQHPDPHRVRQHPGSHIAVEPAETGGEKFSDAALNKVLVEVRQYLQQGALFSENRAEEEKEESSTWCVAAGGAVEEQMKCEERSTVAAWIRNPPVGTLRVRFTPTAQRELAMFRGPEGPGWPRFQFLSGSQEAADALRRVLAADPRSVYRRKQCSDRLFFFSLDTADITCWFGEGFAEVLRVRPVNSTCEEEQRKKSSSVT